MYVAQSLFYEDPGAGPYPRYIQQAQRCLEPCRHFPKKEHSRDQVINLTSSERVKAWTDGPMRFEEYVSLICEMHIKRSQPTDNTTDKTKPVQNCLLQNGQSNKEWLGYSYLTAVPLMRVWGTKPFLRWIQVQGHSPAMLDWHFH